jgi:hypothetical protein
MGRNKDLRKRIAGYREIIEKHETRIRSELAKDRPNESEIAHPGTVKSRFGREQSPASRAA